MISIYNETQLQVIGEVSGGVCNLTKEVNKLNRKDNRKLSVKIGGMNSVFGKDAVSKLKSLTRMKKPEILTDSHTTIDYSKKSFKPFIANKGKFEKNLLLVSLDLRNKEVVEIHNQFTPILEYAHNEVELSLILNISDKPLIIVLKDNKRDNFIRYTFKMGREVEGLINLTKEYLSKEEYEVKEEMKPILKFRPKKPTYIVLREEGEDISKIIWAENRHQIIDVNPDNINNVIENLKSENYTAVTVCNRTKSILSSALDNFKIVYGISGENIIKFKIS